MEKVIIFDTTLRDGEQAPGGSLTSQEKLEVAFQLERLGVDVIEAGFPVASPDDFQAVARIASSIKKKTVCALARCIKVDIEAAAAAVKKAKKPRVHLFLATSKIHLQYKFNKKEDEILDLAVRSTRMARKLCSDIEFSPEDATRSDRQFLYKVIEEVIRNGAGTVNIPDTVGYSYPAEIKSLIEGILSNVPNINKAVISTHCHDDLGMATANSLSAITAGARQVHCTVNGIGERAGNASLEEVVMALRTRRDVFGNLQTAINTKEILSSSRLVSKLTDFVVPLNKAIVGKNAFSHESGIHQDAVLKQRTTYEIMDPADVGCAGSEIVLGKHSGRHALRERLQALGFRLTAEELNSAFARFKQLTDKKKEIYDDDLRIIVDDQLRQAKPLWELQGFGVCSGSGSEPSATVDLKKEGRLFHGRASGDGPVDSCFKAIDKITKLKVRLEDFRLESVTSGKDALGQATLNLKAKSGIVNGRGASTDIIEAAIKAYLDAINRLSRR
ncbi:MAG: 2-isopropylmalate synthase [Candidatus Omnitrophota bacterium]